MVRFLSREQSLDKILQGNSMVENLAGGRQARSMIMEGSGGSLPADESATRSYGSGSQPVEGQIGSTLDREAGPRSRFSRDGLPSDMEQMKERFAKLLLGEDMSGGGKGVSSALALSNAITNLAASVFGEQWRLEPMSSERKARWRKEIDWLLSVTDHIVEFVPSQQVGKDGSNMEIMVTQQRKDLHMNIPALRKLDAMLIGYLDNFKDHNEFWYVSRDADESEKGNAKRKDDKWWLPTVRVPDGGLPEVSKNWLLYQKDLVHQILKAAMAINAQVLMEMEVPEAYIESLPKNGKTSLGDSLYKRVTGVEFFDPDQFFGSLDLSSEHKVLDLKNRIEASVVIWRRKMHNKDSKASWASTVSMEKREQFEERAETILHLIRQRFPGICQSSLDISKIQFNRDVGHAVLESYSRILESLAHTVMSRIEDVLYADSQARDPSQGEKQKNIEKETLPIKKLDPKEELEKLNTMDHPSSMTLSDFICWNMLEQDIDTEEKKDSANSGDVASTETNLKKPPIVVTQKKFSYIENLGGLRSPTARH